MGAWLEGLGVSTPVVQGALGGGISRGRLAAAVSEAGGLGQVCTLAPDAMRAELRAVRERTAAPVAVNLLLPFAGRPHAEAAAGADVVVTFWGAPERPADRPWVHQCGSVAEARAARAAGADAVIAQGVEAGGHVRGTTPALDLLEQVRAALPAGFPVLVAGGIAERADVQRALDAGAEGAVAGTRFLLSDESDAHPGYLARAVAGGETHLTELFGHGWPAPHRVLPNAATRRWLRAGDRIPRWVSAFNRATAPVSGRTPLGLLPRVAALQRPGIPFLSPQPPVAGAADRSLDATALYAGETVARIGDIRPAGDLVRALAGA